MCICANVCACPVGIHGCTYTHDMYVRGFRLVGSRACVRFYLYVLSVDSRIQKINPDDALSIARRQASLDGTR
jgi:hypothetical protein